MSFDCYVICLIRDDQNSTASEIKIYVEGTTFLDNVVLDIRRATDQEPSIPKGLLCRIREE
jgi:hypothetical protein